MFKLDPTSQRCPSNQLVFQDNLSNNVELTANDSYRGCTAVVEKNRRNNTEGTMRCLL